MHLKMMFKAIKVVFICIWLLLCIATLVVGYMQYADYHYDQAVARNVRI